MLGRWQFSQVVLVGKWLAAAGVMAGMRTMLLMPIPA
jgi:hypothetical protein